jgi:hypothetical protein
MDLDGGFILGWLNATEILVIKRQKSQGLMRSVKNDYTKTCF